MTKFKVGDRVRVVKDYKDGFGRQINRVGGTGVIVQISSNTHFPYHVHFGDWNEATICTAYNDDELELLHKFKVGDRVRVIQSYRNFRNEEVNYVGGVGVIHKVRKCFDFECPYVIRFDNPDIQKMHDFTSDYAEHELELVEPAAKPRAKEIRYTGVHAERNDVYPTKMIYAGRKTILLYKDRPEDKKVYRAIAKCNPDDVYYPFVGQQIALKRAHIAKLERELKGLIK